VKYSDLIEEIKNGANPEDETWQRGHDAKRDRFKRQVKTFTSYVDEALRYLFPFRIRPCTHLFFFAVWSQSYEKVW